MITGATGLLGSHLTQKLLERGAFVVALVRDRPPQSLFFDDAPEWQLDRRCTVVRGELEDAPLLERVLGEYEIDTIFHLGAQTIVGTANHSPIPTFQANIQGTWNVLEAARVHQKRIQRIVIASSDKAYGNLGGDSYDENSPLRGEHPYDVSKSCADLISRAYAVSYGLPVTVTRCGNLFGAGDLNFNRIIPGTIQSLLFQQSPVIRSDGKLIRDYIYVEDGAEAYIQLAEAMTPQPDGTIRFAGEAFNFSYGLRLTVLDLVEQLTQLMECSSLEPTILNEAHNEIPIQCLNSTKAREQLNWSAQFGFEEGLKKTIEWYRSRLT